MSDGDIFMILIISGGFLALFTYGHFYNKRMTKRNKERLEPRPNRLDIID